MQTLVGFDPSVLRPAFSRFPSGVAAICAEVQDVPRGLVASSFTVGVSLEPPLVLFAVQKSSETWPVLRQASRLGVSVLSQNHGQVCRQIASKSGDRFAGIDFHKSEGGAILIPGSALWMECEIVSESEAGDHLVVVLEVKSVEDYPETEPLVFHGSTFRRLLS